MGKRAACGVDDDAGLARYGATRLQADGTHTTHRYCTAQIDGGSTVEVVQNGRTRRDETRRKTKSAPSIGADLHLDALPIHMAWRLADAGNWGRAQYCDKASRYRAEHTTTTNIHSRQL